LATAIFCFHGELADFLARERRGMAFSRRCARAATIKHEIEALGVPHTEAGRITVNGLAATLARIVREGDVIEVHPHEAERAAGAPPDFLADAHLGGLARLLRMLGFDTYYRNEVSDRELLEVAARERRVILTRDRELLKHREVLRGRFVHARRPEDQLREVAARFALAERARPFTLCLHCNVRLAPVERSLAAERVPARILERYDVFVHCAGCGRIYWEGSHWERMRAMLAASLEAPLPSG
jgi:uncharacterized protein with PIN domain